MHNYCNFANYYFIIIFYSLSQSNPVSLSLLLSSFSSSTQPINHLPTTTQSMQPTTTILQHKNPTTNSIENQSQNQRKIKSKINKIQTKNQWKSNPKLMETQPQHIKWKTQNKPSTKHH